MSNKPVPGEMEKIENQKEKYLEFSVKLDGASSKVQVSLNGKANDIAVMAAACIVTISEYLGKNSKDELTKHDFARYINREVKRSLKDRDE